jgi:NNP family nitrate/nitrite transporter-like MFS transporter
LAIGARPWIEHWNPDDDEFWERRGHCGQPQQGRNKTGFHFSTAQLFTLVALPTLMGATLRVPYTFAVARFGGRNWTTISALLLLIPAGLLVLMVSHPGTPYWAFLLATATAVARPR